MAEAAVDLEPWLTTLREVVAAHRLPEPGAWGRWRTPAEGRCSGVDVRTALHELLACYLNFLHTLDWDATPGAGDLHAIFGAVCGLAELQRALPGSLVSRRPLRLVLDRRPFS